MHKIFAVFKTQTIKDSFLIGLGTFSTAFFGFLFTIFMARSLSPEKFGVFSALSSLVAILYSLGDLGVGPAIISFLPRHKQETKKIIGTTFWFQYIVAFVIATSLWASARYASYLVPGSISAHFYLLGSLCFSYILVGWAQSVATAKRQFLHISLSQIMDSSIKILLVYFIFRSSGLTIFLSLLANAVSVCVSLFLIFTKELLAIPLIFDKKTFLHLFKFSKWIAISRFFSVLNSKIDILLLNLMSNGFTAGIFAAASRITLLFAIVVSSLGSVVNPRFSKFVNKNDFYEYTKKLFALISLIAFFLLVTIIFADKIILLVFGSNFLDSIYIFRLLSIAMIPFLYSIIFTAALLYTFQDSAFYAFLTFLNIAIIFLIDLIGIPKIGAIAPAIGLFVANCLCLVLSVFRVKHHYSAKLK